MASPGFTSPFMLSMLYKVCITFTRIFLLLIMRKELFLLKLQMYEEVWGFGFRSLELKFLPAAKKFATEVRKHGNPICIFLCFCVSVAVWFVAKQQY